MVMPRAKHPRIYYPTKVFGGQIFKLVYAGASDHSAGETSQIYSRNGFNVRVVSNGKWPSRVIRVYARPKKGTRDDGFFSKIPPRPKSKARRK